MSKRTIIEAISDEHGTALADTILDALQYALEDTMVREIHGNGEEEREYQGSLAARFRAALQALTAD